MNQNRREFLAHSSQWIGMTAASTQLIGCGGGGATASDNSNVGLSASQSRALSELPGASVELHFLKRTSFGVNNDSLARLNSMGIAAFLEQQLNPNQLEELDLETEVQRRFPTTAYNGCRLHQLRDDRRVRSELREMTVFRRIFSQKQLFEVMVEFWSDHFSIYHGDGLVRSQKTVDDREVIRENALGDFRSMLHASARSVAMLEYLDNRFSNKNNPNENYARELMELHTLGVDGGYSETDIKEVARCLTGWTIRQQEADRGCLLGNHMTFMFNAQQHDDQAKTVMDLQVPAGGGEEDGNMVLDYLVDHPATRQFVASKLVRRFVSDQPPASLVQKVANAWGADGDIKAMLRVLFLSDEFSESADQKFMRPMEFVVAAVRSVEPEMDNDFGLRDLLRTVPLLELYSMLGLAQIEQVPQPTAEDAPDAETGVDNDYEGPSTRNVLNRTGHVPFEWPTPDGYPDSTDYWASVNNLLERWKFAISVARQSRGEDLPSNAEFLAVAADTATTIVDNLSSAILRRGLLPEHRDGLIAYAADGKPADEVLSGGQLTNAIKDVAALLYSSPYFQLR